MPTVSVIIPTYNRADVLPSTIDSVLSQSYDDFECIVVDDASTDDTETVVSNYDDERIRYLCHDNNRGANAARNTGIQAATGTYISFLDSDDELLPENLAITTAALEKRPDCAGVFTSFYTVRDGNVESVSIAQPGEMPFERICSENAIGGFTCVMFHTDVFDDIGLLDESFRSYQDWDFFIRVITNHHMVGIDEVLAIHHLHRQQISSNKRRKFDGQDRFIEKHGKKLTRVGRANIQYTRGFIYADHDEYDNAAHAFKTAFKKYPYNFLYLYYYIAARCGKHVYSNADSLKKRAKVTVYSLKRWLL
ncbi:glycosyltransferase family A protein [Halobacterium salinarum]|uniref:glycosyltransferase family 2 protein n=1 Tax=Halobacterium salinarum TaxID=2242 RepID=UPI002552BA86|nr:glycosyltransferase family A protein [Halobacterium salinarum]MDL0138591.1 glycosyltransferase family A protein [Halobacterium salinarum]